MKPNNLESCAMALDMLLTKHASRTCIGALIGSSLAVLAAVFSESLAQIPYVNVSSIRVWQWTALGCLIGHIPTIVHFMRRPTTRNAPIVQAVELIERCALSSEERQRQYRTLVAAVQKSLTQ
jgi:hypothetical protein